jgi:hypothetical protein
VDHVRNLRHLQIPDWRRRHISRISIQLDDSAETTAFESDAHGYQHCPSGSYSGTSSISDYHSWNQLHQLHQLHLRKQSTLITNALNLGHEI